MDDLDHPPPRSSAHGPGVDGRSARADGPASGSEAQYEQLTTSQAHSSPLVCCARASLTAAFAIA